jgi:hypothetical protein
MEETHPRRDAEVSGFDAEVTDLRDAVAEKKESVTALADAAEQAARPRRGGRWCALSCTELRSIRGRKEYGSSRMRSLRTLEW